MSGAVPLLTLYAFMAWTGTTLPFTFIDQQQAIICKQTGQRRHTDARLKLDTPTSIIQRIWAPPSRIPVPKVLGAHCPGGGGGLKWPVRAADQSPRLRAEVKNDWSYSSTLPCAFMSCIETIARVLLWKEAMVTYFKVTS
jgi:hypothetical protein